MYGTGGQHLTPELVLQPRFMQHPNGTRLMTEAVVCASDPEEYARKYSVYTGHDYQRTGGHFDVDFGGTPRVTVTTPEQVASIVPGGIAPADPALVGFTVFVADPQRRGVPGGRQPARSRRGRRVRLRRAVRATEWHASRRQEDWVGPAVVGQ